MPKMLGDNLWMQGKGVPAASCSRGDQGGARRLRKYLHNIVLAAGELLEQSTRRIGIRVGGRGRMHRKQLCQVIAKTGLAKEDF